MPANLPKEALLKYQKVLEAKTKEEKLKALQEYLSAIPKHKGTENLVAQVRHQIAKLRKEIEKESELKKKIGSAPGFNIKKEGDLQYIIVGFTKSGKSSLLSALTNAKSEISLRPYTTTRPVAGAVNYGGVIIQLVDSPSIMENNDDWNKNIISLIRSADGILIVLDATKSIQNDFNRIYKFLLDNGIIIGKKNFSLRFIKSVVKEPVFIMNGEIEGATANYIRRMLIEYGYRNIIIEFNGKATLNEVEAYLNSNVVHKPAIVVINKIDENKVNLDFDFKGLPVLEISVKENIGIERIPEIIFSSSEKIRIYTKEPNEDIPSKKPLVVDKNTKIIEIAEKIHRDLAKNFKYARIWGKSVKFQGEKVGPDHIPMDGDIVEIRA